MENKTDCGQKCFELQDTEHALAVEKENNQKLEAEVKRLKGIVETPCTSCCITESLEYSLDELNDQIVNQDREIRQLKEQIENLEKDKEQIIFESDLKIKALEDHIEELEANSASKDEYIDNLEHDLKDAGGELELWQRENAELKKTNALLYEQEKEKIKLIEKMKCCENCKHLYHVNTGGCYDAKCDLNYLDCINCKDKWELAE